MRKIIFLLLTLFSCLQAIGNDLGYKIYVRLTLNDCITCYQKFQYLDKYNKDLFLVLETKYKLRHEELINEILRYCLPDNKFIYSDSLFNILDSNTLSTVHLYKNKTEIFKCYLKDINKLINKLEKYMSVNNDTIFFNTPLPYDFDFTFSPNKIYLQDKKFNSITIVPRDGKSNSTTIKPLNRLPNIIINKFNRGDTTKFHKINEYYRSRNLKMPNRFESFFVDNNDTLFVTTYTEQFELFKSGPMMIDTGLYPVIGLVKIYNGQFVSIEPIIISLLKDNYFINHFCFYYSNEFKLFSLGKSATGFNTPTPQYNKNEKYVFLTTVIDSNGYIYRKKILPFELSDIYKRNKLGTNNYASFVISYPYLMTQLSSTLYILNENKIVRLDLDTGNSTFNNIYEFGAKIEFVIVDIHKSKNLLKVMYFKKDKYFQATFGIPRYNKLSDEAIFPEFLKDHDEIKLSPKFDADSHVLFFPKKCNCIVRKALN